MKMAASLRYMLIEVLIDVFITISGSTRYKLISERKYVVGNHRVTTGGSGFEFITSAHLKASNYY